MSYLRHIRQPQLCCGFTWLALLKLSDPVNGQKSAHVILIGHGRYLFKNPFGIRIRIVSKDAAVLHQGVDDGAAPASVLTSNEEPVFRPYFERTHGILGSVVVESRRVLYGEAEFVPLVDGIAQGLAHGAFG